MSEPWRAFAHLNVEPADLCASVRWIAPHVHHDSVDNLVLEALGLAERLSEPASSLCLWWIGLRRREFVDERIYGTCPKLPSDLRKALVWIARAEGDGLAAYQAAAAMAAPYEKALRTLGRATREYASLKPVEDAIRSGRGDVSSVIASIPGGWSSAALWAHRTTINDAVDARDRAFLAGLDARFPSVSIPRFTSLQPDERALCQDLLSGLPGSCGTALDTADRTPLDLGEMELGQQAIRACELGTRGLPVEQVSLGLAFWSDAFGMASNEAVSFFSPRHPLAKACHGLTAAMTGHVPFREWFDELLALKADWGKHWTTVVDKTFAASSAAGLMPPLLERWEQHDPEDATRRLVEALRDVRDPELSLVALTRQLEATVNIISQHREEPSWV